ncbi:MAG TPA: hypothetical protein VNS22_11565 [Geminicoccus sp.]|uniref:hypothetical protein n=1 Tax=Geminicoccus sp. TaxID=2024832 RepID=UPI002BDE26B3|nr:hypothetical protein [Geminicoccus sp.]HWL69009.1 hypothetical protein [Geminicoccus sp.]
MIRRLAFLTALLLVLAQAALSAAGTTDRTPPPWMRLSEVMTELSVDPAFVAAVLQRLGRDPDAGGLLGPDQIRRLRILILGEHWEAVDHFPGLTVAGLGRSVRLAALARGYLVGAEGEEPAPTTESEATGQMKEVTEPLALPQDGPALAPDAYLRPMGFGLQIGDRVDPSSTGQHAKALRLAQVLNRLALNPAPARAPPRYQVEVDGEIAATPQDLLALLIKAGHRLEVRDARYFANFGDLIYQGQDVLTPFWLDTGIAVPGTDRPLLVPAGHSQHELHLTGPLLDARLSFYFGIDGRAEFRPIDTLDQAWVLGRVAHVYGGDDALEVVRLAGAIIRTYAGIRDAHPDLPFGGYYRLGVCNDVNAMIELHMQGRTTLFPLTLDSQFFPGDSEVDRLARRLPVDGRADSHPDLQRIFGSIPVDDLAALPLRELRHDLELVKLAWLQGRVSSMNWWDPGPWAAAGGVLATIWLVLWWWRGRRPPVIPSA